MLGIHSVIAGGVKRGTGLPLREGETINKFHQLWIFHRLIPLVINSAEMALMTLCVRRYSDLQANIPTT